MSMRAPEPRDDVIGLVSFERRLLVSVADRIARAPSLPVKMFLCRAVWDSACRLRMLLRALPPDLGAGATRSTPDVRTEDLLQAFTAIPGEAGYVAALCGVIAPFAAAAYAGMRDESHGRSLRQLLGCAARQLKAVCRWGRRARTRGAIAFEVCRISRLAAHGRISRGERVEDETPLRSGVELCEPARERVIRALRYGEAREDTWFVDSPAAHHRYLHQLIAFEINTFEAVSRHIAEFASMPWEFHFDMARQIRDEVAHLAMWLERLPRCGGRLGTYPLDIHEFAVCVGHDVTGRVALLERLIESSALDSLDLNRCLWHTRADAVMVRYLNRVQIDEIAHVRRGNKWLRRLCGPDSALVTLIDRAEALTRARMLESARRLERDGLVPAGNVELVRRKFDDPLCIDVQPALRLRAGFSEDEIATEVARRRAALTGVAPGR